MKFTAAITLIGLVAGIHAGPFLKDGHEYVYDTMIVNAAGTMDVSTHTTGEAYKMKTRVQKNGQTLNVEMKDVQRSMFVGAHLPKELPYMDSAKTKWTPVQRGGKFSVTFDSDGKFQSLTIPSDVPPGWVKNVMKGWANIFQVNYGKYVSSGKQERAYSVMEPTIQGDCEVSYVFTDDLVVKSVAHMKDCKNRQYRFLDDWRGHRCGPDMDYKNPQKKTNTDGLWSGANTQYHLEGEKVKKMVMSGSLVSTVWGSGEGASYWTNVRMTADLLEEKSSSGDISVSGSTLNSLEYEWEDAKYKWNEDRDLKDSEQFFSSGDYIDRNDQGALKTAFKAFMNQMYKNLEPHEEHDKATLQKQHKFGVDSAYFMLSAMNYDTLKSLGEEYFGDASEEGVAKSNIFNEYLGNTGTVASAMVIKDFLMQKKFRNDRDGGRVLTSMPYSIRRPNKQLVQEYEQLLNWQGAERFVKMAIPLSFGHLIRVTCMRAGNVGSPEQMDCWQNFAPKYVKMFWDKYQAASTRDEKHLYLDVLSNIRFGGQAKLLKDLAYGKTSDDAEFRTAAVWAAGWDAMFNGGVNYFFPIFANQKENHEVRQAALTMIFYSKPSTSDMGRIMAVLQTDTCYETINFAYTIFEQFANTINPCHEQTKGAAAFFLKFMKQYSRMKTSYGFGVSKTWLREYQKNKYGYGGAYHYYVSGSEKSTTPLTVYMGMSTTLMHSYERNGLGIYLRLEGVAKGIIRKFKSMDAGTWKTATLEKIFNDDMQIRARKDQPVHAHVKIMVRGAVAISRSYDENSTKEGGKIAEFFKGIMDAGNDYKINHQRMLNFGSSVYEQPNEIGLPVAFFDSMTVLAQLKAHIKRATKRGVITRDVTYEINMMAQGHAAMMYFNPERKHAFAIYQDRVYHIHAPRQVKIGINPIKKEATLFVSKPEYQHPWMFFMHSQVSVTARSNKLDGQFPELKNYCSDCEKDTVVERERGKGMEREVWKTDDNKYGFRSSGHYFDCDMDVSGGNTRGRALYAFTPFNKNPKTPATTISMGFRQIMAFLALYPRIEKCGVHTLYSQSQSNPTTGYDFKIKPSGQENGARMFFRGRKSVVEIKVRAKSSPARHYRLNIKIDRTPGNIHNNIKINYQRPEVAGVHKAYTICAQYESKYNDFGKEMLALNDGEKLKVEGKASLQYGESTECDQGDGELRVKFEHETTDQGWRDLRDKWYFKKCFEQKNHAEWAARTSSGGKLPATEACYAAMYDAASARHYHWEMDFVKQTPRMKRFVNAARTMIQAGLLPYWDVDPDEVEGDDTGRFIKMDVNFKDHDKKIDMKMETSQGVQEFKDYPLKFNWGKRLRNLKFTSTIKSLMDMKIISPCVATSKSIRTNDNVTYEYQADSQWTLVSGHCAQTPSYGVFTKRDGPKFTIMIYIGGHQVEIKNGAVKINGKDTSLQNGKSHKHSVSGQEIFEVFKWGSTINVYSFLRVWVATDNNYVQVMPAPSVRGQHCGLCGNFNRNMFDEWTGKNEQLMTSAADMVNEWRWSSGP